MIAKTALVAALAAAVSAQNSTVMNSTEPYNITFAQGLSQYLATMGLTAIAGAVGNSTNSPGTLSFLENINGTAKTLLVPTNAAFAGIAPNATMNATLLGARLSYHLLSGNFTSFENNNTNVHTVVRTYLSDPGFDRLEGNKTQALSIGYINNQTTILNQNTNVTILNTTTYQGLTIHVVSAVIDTPGDAVAAFTTYNLTAAPTALNAVNFTAPILAAHGITLFVPNDQAFANAAQMLAGANSSVVSTVLANHVINGTTAYSTELVSGGFTSAGGQSISMTTNSSGSFVTSGNTTAKVLYSDVILQNGVMHIIDSILLNMQSNPTAASSAYMAATSSAAQGGQQTGAVGGASPTETGPIGGSASSSSKSAAGKMLDTSSMPIMQAIVVLSAVLGGAVLLI